ncbi:MAG: peptidoglycan DD-metalloendopeptidase family protein [Bacteroidales bacterium]
MRPIIIILILVLFSINGKSQDKHALEQQKQAAIKELEIAKELLNKTQNSKVSTIKRIGLINRGIESREGLIQTIVEEIELIEEEIFLLEEEIGDLGRKIEQGNEDYARIIYSIFINHTEEEKLMYLLASKNINEFYQRIKYMKYLKEYREDKIAELEGMKIALERRNAQLLSIRNEKSDLLKEIELESRRLIRERSERNDIIRRLAQDERRIRSEIQQKERIRQELETEIRRIIESEANKRSSSSLLSSLTPEQKLVGSNFFSNKGRLPWPVERGIITAKFGIVNHPVLSGVKISNNGVDISTTSETKARAVYDGEVTSIFAILGANYTVIVMHGEYLSVYQNLIDLNVKVGDKVKAKQELGTVHSDVNEDMAILHLQIWKSKDILNPIDWLSK